MFTDPQTLTVSGVAKTLNRTGVSTDGANYATADRALQMSIAHSYGRRTRHVIKLKSDTLVANPLVAGQNITQSMSVALTVDVPNGYDAATAKAVVDSLIASLSATSGASITKILGGES